MTDTEQRGLPVYDHRAGTGPTLVFLHYWGGSSRTWAPVVARLEDRDTVTIDFRGWGPRIPFAARVRSTSSRRTRST